MATSKLRFLLKSLGLAMAFAAVHGAKAFSVFGPAEAWQTPTLDYVTRYYYTDTEIGAPKNFGQGSRLNIPIVTYGFDATFLEYFGTPGVAAVDSAMAVLNALPTASTLKLANYVMQGNQQINYTAEALELTDLKSVVLSLMVEHMGLIGETHVWDLRTRNPLPGAQCSFAYLPINRNYDPVTFLPSTYVNGVNYTYGIWDGCSNNVSVADAIELTVDEASPAEVTYTAVATRYAALVPGAFYLNLTYDDVGGLKYLYSKNNLAYEGLDSNSVVSTFGGGGSTTGGSPWLGISPGTNGTGTGTGGGIPITTTTSNLVGLLGGVEKITYLKVPYNSLTGSNIVPVVYTYNVGAVVNGRIQSIPVTRTVNRPDILFSAGDLELNTLGAPPLNYNIYSRGFNFNPSGAVIPANGVEPEVISPQENITFNDITPAYFNETPSFLSGQTSLGSILIWGSYDGTTNAPIMYPQSSSLASLLGQLLGTPGSAGSATTTTGNGTWTGLTLGTNGLNITGTATGGTP